MLGTTELIVILLMIIVVFGANKLPGLGDALGRSIKNFRRAASGKDELEVSEKDQLQASSEKSKLPTEEAEVVET